MKKNIHINNRRGVLKKLAGTALLSAVGMSLSHRVLAAENFLPEKLKGKIRHSVCRWCYKDIPLEDLCKAAKKIGISSIELTGPEEWPLLKKYGLVCAMPWRPGKGVENGFNNPDGHDELVKSYEEIFPKVADAGFDKIICFSGNRNGLSDEEGLENCAVGLKRLMLSAEKFGITMTMELLNSKVDHPDYQCDHTAWGAALADKIGSEHFKLLYDIYHMEIMEGDVIYTIYKYHAYISHYHTGGVPGRNEIDETQKLNYPAIMRAILETGYQGYVGQEFVPKRKDKLASLEQGVKICDVA